jgi:hypothetical protein
VGSSFKVFATRMGVVELDELFTNRKMQVDESVHSKNQHSNDGGILETKFVFKRRVDLKRGGCLVSLVVATKSTGRGRLYFSRFSGVTVVTNRDGMKRLQPYSLGCRSGPGTITSFPNVCT